LQNKDKNIIEKVFKQPDIKTSIEMYNSKYLNEKKNILEKDIIDIYKKKNIITKENSLIKNIKIQFYDQSSRTICSDLGDLNEVISTFELLHLKNELDISFEKLKKIKIFMEKKGLKTPSNLNINDEIDMINKEIGKKIYSKKESDILLSENKENIVAIKDISKYIQKILDKLATFVVDNAKVKDLINFKNEDNKKIRFKFVGDGGILSSGINKKQVLFIGLSPLLNEKFMKEEYKNHSVSNLYPIFISSIGELGRDKIIEYLRPIRSKYEGN
jgi:hypothetical protein